MKKLCFLVIAFFVLKQTVFSQKTSHKIDSLTQLLKQAKTDTARINYRGMLSQEYMNRGDSINAFSNGYQNLQVAKKQYNTLYKAAAHSDMGYLHLKLLNSDSVKYHYNTVLKLLEKNNTYRAKRLKIVAVNNLAYAYSVEGNMKKALSYVINNLPLIKSIGDTVAYRGTVHNISAAFTSMGQPEKAYPYLKEDLFLVENAAFPAKDKAETYISAAILLYDMDSLTSTAIYLNKAYENLTKIGKHNLWGRYYSINARYLAKIGKIHEAKSNLEVMFQDIKAIKNATNEIDAYVALLDVERAAKNYHRAKDAALQLYKRYKLMGDFFKMANAAKDVAYLSENMGDYKTAYTYINTYAKINDSVSKQQMLLDLHDMEAQYQTSEKENRIIQLQSEQKQNQLVQKNQRLLNWLLGIGAFIFFISLIFMGYVYKNNKRHNVQKLKEVEQQKKLEITQAILNGEEGERQRIARDLHDGLGGALSGIKIKLFGHQKQLASTDLNESILQLEESINELRRIARNMMPETLMRSGLEVALKDLCVSLTSSKTLIELQTNGIQKSIPLNKQVHIFRIIQELLANALKHSNAKHILVQCIQNQNKLFITVEDDGQGFYVNNAKATNGMGLSNIKNRVTAMNGLLDIDSLENNGTTINIEVHV